MRKRIDIHLHNSGVKSFRAPDGVDLETSGGRSAAVEAYKEALSEAAVNAVGHRDYTIRGPVRLLIPDDRVELHTPGKPPNDVDAGSMRASPTDPGSAA